jgi:hypothetical protein
MKIKNMTNMGTFQIDFFELSFLAEACIPSTPIARAVFWSNLTDRYWEQMTQSERDSLFEWMNRNDFYKESLKEHESTQVFHARFDPNNQYLVKTKYKGEEKEVNAFMMNERYYISTRTYIASEYIINITKLEHEKSI